MGATLAEYALIPLVTVAAFLDICPHTAQLIDLPWIMVGRQWKLDPLDLAVYVLAQKEGCTVDEYWIRYGEGTPENATRYVRRIRKLRAGTVAA